MAQKLGVIAWCDLTIPDATNVSKFYSEVAGWTPDPVDMGGYSDYCMNPSGGGDTVAGVCHARGINANIPPQWLIYITVKSVEHSIEQCKKLGGKVINGPRSLSGKQFCILQDPAGAVAAFIEA